MIRANDNQLSTKVNSRLQRGRAFFKSNNVEDVRPEESCAMPRYYPGDIILTKDGAIGIIQDAHVTINGGSIEWNEAPPENIEHGWPPSYSLGPIRGFPEPGKHAWWEAKEWAKVAKGVLHRVLDEVEEPSV